MSFIKDLKIKISLPSPLSIAILLTILTYLMALLLTDAPTEKVKILNNDNKLLVELDIDNEKSIYFKPENVRDSIIFYIENKNQFVLKYKTSGELIYRKSFKTWGKKELNVRLSNSESLKISKGKGNEPYFLKIMTYWESGFFSFLAFAMQMMMILVLGNVLALTKPISKLISKIVNYCNNTANAAWLISFVTILVAFFNWGLGLIFGAVLARKAGEKFMAENKPFNYPLIAAAGYSGMMVWHGGLSGSSTLKIAEQNHEFADKIGVIPVSDTIFSAMNISASLLILMTLPLALYMLGKKIPVKAINLNLISNKVPINNELKKTLDNSSLFSKILGLVILFVAIYKAIIQPIFINNLKFDWTFSFINPNYIIFILFGLAIMMQQNLKRFEKAVEESLPGASGIMIQFPFYAGIMGIMSQTGLVIIFADFFESISNSTTFPLFTFISSGIINFFVPSGGGQWLVQGPIVINGAESLGVSYEKAIMALCYGDQLTNMLQPFWALPLLGITKLKAQEILPFSFFVFLIGFILFSVILLIF